MSEKPLPPHKTVDMPLKMISVDEGMVPIIEWLNGFDSVLTQYCCQGEYKYPASWLLDPLLSCEYYNRPGVLFVVESHDDLIEILRTVDDFVKFWPRRVISVSASYYTPMKPVRYDMRFINRHVVEQFVACLDEGSKYEPPEYEVIEKMLNGNVKVEKARPKKGAKSKSPASLSEGQHPETNGTDQP